MTRSKSVGLTLLFVVTLTGCATGPKFSEMASDLSKVSPESGRVFFYRKTVAGAAVQPEVRLNGEVVGKAIPRGFFYVDREPGSYKVETSTEVDRKLSFLLEKGQTRYVRLNISIGFFVGHVYPELAEPEEGKEEIRETSYTGQ